MYRELSHTSLLFSPCFLLGQLLEMMDQSLWSTSCPTPARRGPGTPVTPPLGRATRPRWLSERRAPADTQRSEEGFRGWSGRSPDHPRKRSSLLWVSGRSSSLDMPAHSTISGNLLRFSWCRRGARRSESQRGRVARPSGGVTGVPGPLRADVGHDALHSD